MTSLIGGELDLPAAGSEQGRLIVASIALTNHLITHDGMPPLGAPALRYTFPMPDGATDQERAYRLGEIAQWLGAQVTNYNGTYQASRDFGGLTLSAHFTPRHIQEARTEELLHGLRRVA